MVAADNDDQLVAVVDCSTESAQYLKHRIKSTKQLYIGGMPMATGSQSFYFYCLDAKSYHKHGYQPPTGQSRSRDHRRPKVTVFPHTRCVGRPSPWHIVEVVHLCVLKIYNTHSI